MDNENKIIWNTDGSWSTKESLDNMKKIGERMQARFDYHLVFPEAREKFMERSNNKEEDTFYAYIRVGHKQKLAYVTKDMKTAYKCDGYAKTLIKWPNFQFERWCSSMDI